MKDDKTILKLSSEEVCLISGVCCGPGLGHIPAPYLL